MNMTYARDICWLCGGKLIWGADFDPEELGYDATGICALLTCSKCNAEVWYTCLDEEE